MPRAKKEDPEAEAVEEAVEETHMEEVVKAAEAEAEAPKSEVNGSEEATGGDRPEAAGEVDGGAADALGEAAGDDAADDAESTEVEATQAPEAVGSGSDSNWVDPRSKTQGGLSVWTS